MAIWKRQVTLAEINARGVGCMVEHLGIRFTALHDDGLEATMPVDARTRQPFGLLHGGASAVLAETLGSMAGYLCTQDDEMLVGLEINANHLRAVREGEVRGRCRPLHLGGTHQVWQIEIYDGENRLCCSSRLTTSVRSGAARR
ncbi:thioesterase [Mixta theicola]|uniref:Thioesterase n=1 Tax=Mixta theicola TaxID=1458355 RepID=A0A2K1QDS1_9GAMM|nr:hotdog fold thioesterase [Mixta theicola]PNS13177.1 thioesterase [Mixta theicola]GLR09453.1 acyl-CoA esterase [Mixta theicola]